eukprot:2268466-Rhodomonas_salina.2
MGVDRREGGCADVVMLAPVLRDPIGTCQCLVGRPLLGVGEADALQRESRGGTGRRTPSTLFNDDRGINKLRAGFDGGYDRAAASESVAVPFLAHPSTRCPSARNGSCIAVFVGPKQGQCEPLSHQGGSGWGPMRWQKQSHRFV